MDPNKIEEINSQHAISDTVCSNRLVVNVPEMAAILRIGRTKAYELIHQNKIRYFKVGRDIRIPMKAIEEFLETC